jgi:mannonate dehydratase
MVNNRRSFIKKAATAAAAGSIIPFIPASSSPVTVRAGEAARDAGMQLSEAYFWGPDPQRIAYSRQMDVLGAVSGVRTANGVLPWSAEAIKANKQMWEKEGLKWNVIEGPPALGEQTKLGLEGRDEEIEHFITFMKNLRQHSGIDVICYNWMPVIGWYRTNNEKKGRGGALVTAFDYEEVKNAALTKYGEVSKEALWKNLEYFLKAVMPEAEKIGMKLAMHPDDPQVDSIRGIGRIMNTVENFKKLLKLYPSPSNGITMCQGNFALMGTDIPTLIRDFGKETIHFVHFRNVRGGKYKFEETFHDEGDIDMFAAMQAYYDIGFRGAIRPDHVPTMAGDSNEHAGYSNVGILYALGYIRGLMEAVSKSTRT